MKTKFNFNLGAVSIENVEVKDISMEMEVEYSSKEMFDMYKLMKNMIKDLPIMLEDMKIGYETFNRINEEIIESETQHSMFDIKEVHSEEVTESRMEQEVRKMIKDAFVNNFRYQA